MNMFKFAWLVFVLHFPIFPLVTYFNIYNKIEVTV